MPTSRVGWRLLLGSVFRRKRILVPGLASALAWTAAKVTVPLLVAAGIDRGIEHHDLKATFAYAAVIAAVGAVQGVLAGVRRFYAMQLGYQVETDLRGRLFAHLQRLHFAFHDQAQTGQLMSRSASDLQQVSDLLMNGPLTVASIGLGLTVAVVLLLTQPLLALLALWPLLLLGFSVRRFTLKMHPAALSLQNELGELSSVAEEAVSGVRTIKGFGAERVIAEGMARRATSVLDKALVTVRYRSGFASLVNFFPALGLVGVLYYGGRLVIEGQMQVGVLVAATIYVQMLVAPLTNLGFVAALSQRAVAACERIDQILSLSPVIADPPHPVELPPTGSAIRFEHVAFGYPTVDPDTGAVPRVELAADGSLHETAVGAGMLQSGRRRRILDGFDLVVPEGQSIALVGATGSGKSTVAKLLPRFYDADEGAVTIAGVDVRHLRLAELRRAVGIVFEDTFLFSDTIRANIAFSEPDAGLERVRAAARLAGADEFIQALPDGYETELGERGLSLSGGQRQRISIARAVLGDPRVLILDDATSAVDPEKEREIAEALAEVMHGRTTVLIAHRVATIALADRVALISDGRVAALGTHTELLETSPAYRQVLAHNSEQVA